VYPTGLLGFGDVRWESEGRDMRVELVLRGGAREVEVGGRCGYAKYQALVPKQADGATSAERQAGFGMIRVQTMGL
jgi:hypothetical protein